MCLAVVKGSKAFGDFLAGVLGYFYALSEHTSGLSGMFDLFSIGV